MTYLSQNHFPRGSGRTYRMLERAIACVQRGEEGIIIGNRHVHDMFLHQVRKAMPAAKIERSHVWRSCTVNGRRWRLLSSFGDNLRGLPRDTPLFVDHYTLDCMDSHDRHELFYFEQAKVCQV